MKLKPLSATMAAALAMAIEHGGRLEARRFSAWTYPGAPTEYRHGGVPDWFFSRATVLALVARGEMKIVDWKLSRGQRWPIAAEVVA